MMFVALLAAIILLAAAILVLGAVACYQRGVRDGLEEKTWLAELPPVEAGELGARLLPLDLDDTTDTLIYLARLEENS